MGARIGNEKKESTTTSVLENPTSPLAVASPLILPAALLPLILKMQNPIGFLH